MQTGNGAIGFLYPTSASTTSANTTAVFGVAGPLRIRRIAQFQSAGGGASSSMFLDAVQYGDMANATVAANTYLVMGSLADGIATATVFNFTTASSISAELDLYIIVQAAIYHRITGGPNAVKTTVYYEASIIP